MTKTIEQKIDAVARKIPNIPKEEKTEVSRQLITLAELLIDMKELDDEKSCGLH